ncbi:GntR family transcriptional regulator [Cryobacterium sp. Y50]|uniref:GntR family transcriptional regulator n=1 Tax=Cryobacterium sp. Y50 TaxID=2048286 RepID=UPI000CE4F605|nr:GntR family transcriptional regulator [Cryobacterium sp. Y50]
MFTGGGPIYQQLADHIAEDIMAGTYSEESSVPSTNEYAVFYQISPITATKSVNLLVEQGVLYKKRGIGMFVATGARDRLHKLRRSEFRKEYVAPLVHEARLLEINRRQLAEMIDQENKK